MIAPASAADAEMRAAVARFEAAEAIANVACEAADDGRLRLLREIGPEPKFWPMMTDAQAEALRMERATWRERERALRAELGLDTLERIKADRMDEFEAAIDALCDTPARTMEGLILKARHAMNHGDIGDAIIADLQAAA